MLRRCLILFVVVAITTLSSGGCRSCSDCHDYDPPVAGCDCGGCGQRAGSACACGSCGSGGCDSRGCDGSDGYHEGQPAPTEPEQPVVEPADEEVGA
jgi:hypothetical protein